LGSLKEVHRFLWLDVQVLIWSFVITWTIPKTRFGIGARHALVLVPLELDDWQILSLWTWTYELILSNMLFEWQYIYSHVLMALVNPIMLLFPHPRIPQFLGLFNKIS
jgi:hypothetical protein